METGITVIEDANVEAVRGMFEEATMIYVRFIRTHSASIQATLNGDSAEAASLGREEDILAAEHAAYCTCISHLVEESAREVSRASSTVGDRALAEL